MKRCVATLIYSVILTMLLSCPALAGRYTSLIATQAGLVSLAKARVPDTGMGEQPKPLVEAKPTPKKSSPPVVAAPEASNYSGDVRSKLFRRKR